jgi:hypothetical protein
VSISLRPEVRPAFSATRGGLRSRDLERREEWRLLGCYAVALVRIDVSEELTANVPSSSILVTLMMEALGSSETSVVTRATWRNIPEDTILHSYRRENLKSYLDIPIRLLV